MKMIKPIVNLSKIIDDYEVIVMGLYGTLFDGQTFQEETKQAIKSLSDAGKKIIILSNTSKRVAEVVNLLKQNDINLKDIYSIITAGEVLHYQLKSQKGLYGSVGTKYYCIGKPDNVFAGLGFEKTNDISKADFIYSSQQFEFAANVDQYKPDMSFAISLNIPLVCAGNNTANFKGGVIEIDSGAFAEQYATLGGKILTTGKPDLLMLKYALDDSAIENTKVLFIGSNIQTDIKMANLYGISSVLISKGIHKHFLGEGYIPDVAKTRELATSFNSFPDYVISNVRY